MRQIAGENRFLHWELEFADLFEDRGGFDLVLGNPPWVKLTWEEKEVLSNSQPLFAVRKYTFRPNSRLEWTSGKSFMALLNRKCFLSLAFSSLRIDSQPLFAVRNLTAAQTTQQRDAALADADTRRMYFKEYVKHAFPPGP